MNWLSARRGVCLERKSFIPIVYTSLFTINGSININNKKIELN